MPTRVLRVVVDPTGAVAGAARAKASIASITSPVNALKAALVGLGAAFAIKKVVSEFAAFEEGLIGIGKTANISGRELQQLGQGVQTMARSLPVATNELLEIAQAAGQLGVRGNEDLLRFTDTVGKLSLATNLGGADAATTLARILTVTGTSVSQVDRLGSVIVRLGNNFAATESEIAGVAIRVAQATTTFGVSAADVVSIATAMRALGVQAELAGSSMVRTFSSINKAVRRGGEEMAVLTKITGQTAEQLQEAFVASPGDVFQDFIQGLGRISDAGGDVTAALNAFNLEGIRIEPTLGVLAKRVDVVNETMRQGRDEWKANTALTTEALVAAGSFSAQMQLVSNAVNETAAEIGRELAPAILEASQGFREFITAAKDSGALAEFGESVGGVLQGLVDDFDLLTAAGLGFLGLKLGAAFGPLGAAIGGTAGGLIGLAIATDRSTSEFEKHIEALDREIGRLRTGKKEADAFTTSLSQSVTEAIKLNQAQLELAKTPGSIPFGRGRGPVLATQRVKELEGEGAALRDRQLEIDTDRAFSARERAAFGLTVQEPSSLKTAGGGDDLNFANDNAKTAGASIEAFIRSLNDEATALTVVTAEREAFIAVLRAEEIARQGGIQVTEQQIDTIGTLVESRRALEAQNLIETLERESMQMRALAVASGLGQEALDAATDAIAAQNVVLAQGIDLQSELGQAINKAALEQQQATRVYGDAKTELEKTQGAADGLVLTLTGDLTRALTGSANSFEDFALVAIRALQSIVRNIDDVNAALAGDNAGGIIGAIGEVVGFAASLFGGASAVGGAFGVGNTTGVGGAGFSFLGSGGPRAHGGPVVPGKAYLVGERGPEPFIPNTAGTILPNSALKGGEVNIHQTFNISPDVGGAARVNLIQLREDIKRETLNVIVGERRRNPELFGRVA